MPTIRVQRRVSLGMRVAQLTIRMKNGRLL
jgi:hypothetical protein